MGSLPPPPSRQSVASSSLNFLVIGAGSRGTAYAQAVTVATRGHVGAIAEPDAFKRADFGRKFIWGPGGSPGYGQEFLGWSEWIEWETARRRSGRSEDVSGNREGQPSHVPITGVFICTLDATHATIIRALAPLNLHILCEKPLALSLSDCLDIQHLLSPSSTSDSEPSPRILSIGHVLRYSPHNLLLRKLLLSDQSIGEIVSINHTEPVGWWHFAHSYVRGNWRRATQPGGIGSLLTKCCHDIDFILWLLCSPSALTGPQPHLPSSISSVGNLTEFRRGRKPKAAGAATNCLSCPLADEGCIYSAKKIYLDTCLRQLHNTGWPVKIVVPEIEEVVAASDWDAGDAALTTKLAEDWDRASMTDEEIARRSWYGRCVYESDNDVVDDQVVTLSWDEDPIPMPTTAASGGTQTQSEEQTHGRGPKTAILHMTHPTQSLCERRGRIYGSRGEITYDSTSVWVHTFADGATVRHNVPTQEPEVEKAHGGGDFGLVRNFVRAVEAVSTGEMAVEEAQWRFVGCDVEEVVRSHAVVMAAEEARMEKKVVDWGVWWAERLAEFEERTKEKERVLASERQ